MTELTVAKRPWLQFTLRNLLVLSVGVALGFAPLRLWEFTAPAKPQVAVDIKILEVLPGAVRDFGLAPSATGLAGGQHVADAEQINRRIEALKGRGVKVMAAPTLMTLSGRPTKLNLGGEIPLPVTDDAGLATIEYREVGTSVEIVPTLQRNGRIGVVLQTEISRIDPQTDEDALVMPVIHTVSCNTELELTDGGTAVFGGQAIDPEDPAARAFLVFVLTVRSPRSR